MRAQVKPAEPPNLPTKSWQIINFCFQPLIIKMFYYAVNNNWYDWHPPRFLWLISGLTIHILWVTVITPTPLSTNYMMIVPKSKYLPLNSRPYSQLPLFAFTWYICITHSQFKFDLSKLIHHPILSSPKLFHLLISHLTECNHYPPLSSLKIGSLLRFFFLSFLFYSSSQMSLICALISVTITTIQTTLSFTTDNSSKLLHIVL